ncbi:MAG: beta-ketoacyl synthase chain length factor [Niabella sp.]
MYIHEHICISPQQTTGTVDLDTVVLSKEGKLVAVEPALEGVPPGMIRRMSKAVRMGMEAGLPLVKSNVVDGIIIGTANGGMEDCIKFLNQIIDYEEGLLTPGNFVQSTPNALAGQLSLVTKNHSYNATHVHLGLAFENALTDAQMLLHDHPGTQYLVGGVDEISSYNYNIDYLAGWYDRMIENTTMYKAGLPATIAGEGAAMFLVNDKAESALAKIAAIENVHTEDEKVVKKRFLSFIEQYGVSAEDTLLISGENGNTRLQPFYNAVENEAANIPAVHFKHLCGEYPTAASFAVWLACYALSEQLLPEHFYKNNFRISQIEQVIIYNNYHGKQHSFMLLRKAS